MSPRDGFQRVYEFMRRSGVSLDEFSTAVGLTRGKALELLDLMAELHVMPIGVEVWRRTLKGYDCDSRAIWYSEGASLELNLLAARQFIEETVASSDALFAVQF